MIKLFLLIPFLLAFNYKPSLNQWELNEREVNATKISIRANLHQLKLYCDKETLNDLFPLNCLRLLENIKYLNPTFDYDQVESNLDKKCVGTILKIKSYNQIKQIEPLLTDGSRCERVFKERMAIIKYKLGI